MKKKVIAGIIGAVLGAFILRFALPENLRVMVSVFLINATVVAIVVAFLSCTIGAIGAVLIQEFESWIERIVDARMKQNLSG